MTAQQASVLTDFDRLGGDEAVTRLVEAFYDRMDSVAEASTIRAMHQPDLSSTKEVLRRYLGEWLGGPALYSQERGHPRLRSRHIQLQIGPAERDAWMLCMTGALNAEVADPALRAALNKSVLKLADWVRNDPECPHDNR